MMTKLRYHRYGASIHLHLWVQAERRPEYNSLATSRKAETTKRKLELFVFSLNWTRSPFGCPSCLEEPTEKAEVRWRRVSRDVEGHDDS